MAEHNKEGWKRWLFPKAGTSKAGRAILTETAEMLRSSAPVTEENVAPHNKEEELPSVDLPTISDSEAEKNVLAAFSVKEEVQNKPAEELLNMALVASPFARMEDAIPDYIKNMVMPVRNAYFVTSFNFWNKKASRADVEKQNLQYQKTLPLLKAELNRIKGIEEEDKVELLRSICRGRRRAIKCPTGSMHV
jgi:hypothetical protein